MLIPGTLVVVSVSTEELTVSEGDVRNVSTENADIYFSSCHAACNIGSSQKVASCVVGIRRRPARVSHAFLVVSLFGVIASLCSHRSRLFSLLWSKVYGALSGFFFFGTL